MPNMTHPLRCLASWLFLAFCTHPTSASEADDSLRRLMSTYWEAEMEASPLAANLFGSTKNRDRVEDFSDEAFEARKARMESALTALEGIPLADLTRANQVNRRVFEWMLRHERRTMDFDWRYITFNTMGGVHTNFAQVVLALPNATEQDYRDLLKRLAAFGPMIDQVIELEQRGTESGWVQPCEVLEGYGDTIIGWAADAPEQSAFYAHFARLPESLAPVRDELQAAARKVISEVVHPTLQRYHDFFQSNYLPFCREQVGLSSVPRGRELYDHFVRFYTSLDTDADRVHELGLREVERIEAEMQAIKEEVEFDGDLGAFREFLRTDPQFYAGDAEEYLEYVARITKQADLRMPEFFAELPRNPYGILPVPAQTAPKTTTAYYQPGAADGTRAGVYFVNTYDLASRPLYELPALSVHEAVPGHHHQISLQQEMPDLPEFRRYYYFHAFGEGWGLYTEKLGIEMGMYRTPYEHFGRLVYEMWRACRLVVDTGMHAKGWTRQRAMDFMMEHSGLTLLNVTAEVDRYITYPGQALAYKHGELQILDIRKRAEEALGDRFSLREFHSALLGNGSLPLSILDDLMNEWIEEQRAN